MKEIILNYGFEESFSFNDKNYERIGLQFYANKNLQVFRIIDFVNDGKLPLAGFLKQSNFLSKELTSIAFVQDGVIVYEKSFEDGEAVDICYDISNSNGTATPDPDGDGFGILSITMNR